MKTMYEKMQDLWVKETGLKVGDSILVTNNIKDTFLDWPKKMGGSLGLSTGDRIVKKITPDGIVTDACSCCHLPFTCIEKKIIDSRPAQYYPKNTSGLFIARDTDCGYCWIWEANKGLQKFEGCVEWGVADNEEECSGDENGVLCLTVKQVKSIWGHTVEEEKAYLVTSDKNLHEWTDVTEEVRLTE